MLVRIIKSWTAPDLMRQTRGSSGSWGDFQFTGDPVGECDAVIVLNHVSEEASVCCPPQNVWAIMQEPYIEGVFDWMMEGHRQYAHVFTHHPPTIAGNSKYIRCHPAVPWHVNASYDELMAMDVPKKRGDLSWITSNLAFFPGHKLRMSFLAYLQANSFSIDLYGKGIRYIEDKWEGLAPYYYSLAIENSSSPDYWTEKLADCFLSWTVPIYYGCTNLEEYFPPEAFIRIDIERPQEAMRIISEAVTIDDWSTRLPALARARELVLNRYQFFPQISNLLGRFREDSPSERIVLQPYCKQHGVIRSIRRRLSRILGNA